MKTNQGSFVYLGWAGALLVIALWLVGEVALARWGDRNLPIELTISAYPGSVDLAFMGNSRVAAGIQPQQVVRTVQADSGNSLTSYNLGIGSTPVGVHFFLLKRLVEAGKQPRTLVYGFVDDELTNTDFTDDYNLAQVSEFRDYPLLFEQSFSTIDSRADLFIKQINRLYRYRFHIRNTLEKLLTRTQTQTAKISRDEGGFQDFRNIVRQDAIDALRNGEAQNYQKLYASSWSFAPEKTYLGSLTTLCREAGIRLVFVEMPVTGLHYQQGNASPQRAQYMAALRTYLQAQGTALVDLRSAIADTQLPDTMHLSVEGAAEFSKRLARVPALQDLVVRTGSR